MQRMSSLIISKRIQALVDEETVVKMINFSYNIFRDPKMEAEFLHSQVCVMQAELSVSVSVSVPVVSE
jgi:hypothetical protein